MDDTLDHVDILEIKRLIPHRYPFLMIERVINIRHSDSAVGIKNVSVNEPHFEGHFPARPVMPGVLIVEAMAQTASVVVVKSLDMADHDLLVYFMSLEKTKFRRVVEPGDQLELHVQVVKNRGKVWKFWGEAKVEGQVAAEAEFTAMIQDPPK
ncbi:3-hydroxyacyl-ACP dehydratase FabZ [Rhodobacteraceae bacterium 9Alg 56]|uniref:3-hydroxyacyl-[acyl-carrier-protein] dehydratase FabZ n=1 Tax=Algicella marina TaxID=2683284 RepID=A0A6P1T9I0_9RHOB|nr:3-hydroxyacyl-ACP dehydratase FabZ [Algicella marina]